MTGRPLADALADALTAARDDDTLTADTRAAVMAHLRAAADMIDTPTTKPARPTGPSRIAGALDADRGAGITIGQPRRRRRD